MKCGRKGKETENGKHYNLKRKVVTVKRKGALFWTLAWIWEKAELSILNVNVVQEEGSGGGGEGTSVESAGVDAGGVVLCLLACHRCPCRRPRPSRGR